MSSRPDMEKILPATGGRDQGGGPEKIGVAGAGAAALVPGGDRQYLLGVPNAVSTVFEKGAFRFRRG